MLGKSMKTAFLLIFSFSAACQGLNGLKNEEPEIGVEPDQLLSMLRVKSVKVIDVRNPWELQDEGKIAGSTNIPLSELNTALSLSPEAFQATYKIPLPKKDDCNLVFHCKSGGRSLKAVTLARKMGWFCSRHLLGGFDAWKQLGHKNL